MSVLLTAANQQLLMHEFNRLKLFVQTEGYQRRMQEETSVYGIVKNSRDAEWRNLRVVVSSASGSIDVGPGFAVNSDAELITNPEIQTLAVPNDGVWRWVRIEYAHRKSETGTVSISSAGVMTGTGTKFTEVLRAGSVHPCRIEFLNSVLGNTQKYVVADVISDTSATLQGSFTAETGLKYQVDGTFTPGYVVPPQDLGIYRYDSIDISLLAESVTNTPPARVPGRQFYLARVRCSGGVVTVQDKRTEVWKTQGEYDLVEFSKAPSVLAGVEAVRWDSENTPQSHNIVDFAWGFRSENWTINTSLRQLTLNAGRGGRFRQTTDFSNGDFNGWVVYTPNGASSRVLLSTLSGTQINLLLDYLNPDDFRNTVRGPGTCIATGTVVTGTGTAFLTGAFVGWSITVAGQTRRIVAILSNNVLHVAPENPFTGAISGSYTLTQPFQVLVVPDTETVEVIAETDGPTVGGTGTIVSTVGTAVVGLSTLFTTEISVGDRISVGTETRTVTAIADNLNLSVGTPFSGSFSGTYTVTRINRLSEQADFAMEFPVNTPVARLSLLCYANPLSYYNIRYRYRTFKGYTDWFGLRAGVYFNELAHDPEGYLRNPLPPGSTTSYPNQKYPSGGIVLTYSPGGYDNFNLGDLSGVERILISNTSRFKELIVGKNRQTVVFEGGDIISDHYVISLKKTGLKLSNGNQFIIDISGLFDLKASAKQLQIRQDADSGSPSTTGTILQAFNFADLYENFWSNPASPLIPAPPPGSDRPEYRQARYWLRCVFDGSNWLVSVLKKGLVTGSVPVGGIIMWSGSTADLPPNWALCNGSGGTPDLRNRFILADDGSAIGGTGGSSYVILSTSNLPPHNHTMYFLDDLVITSGSGEHYLRAADGSDTAKITTDGGFSNEPFSIMPPFYRLAFIMRMY